jgi:methylmalonyl-CoA/ethylmalonyl-CoA epimerase
MHSDPKSEPRGRSGALKAIGQISIRVLDLDRAVATYRDSLGLRFLFQAPPALAFFECGGVRLMLSPPEPGELDHAASIIYFTVEDIEGAHAQLSVRGVHFRTAPHQVADMGDRVLWLSDFDDGEGNVFALMAEVPKHAGARRAPDFQSTVPRG